MPPKHLIAAASALILIQSTCAQAFELDIIPQPKTVTLKKGILPLGLTTRIACETKELLPLGRLLADDFRKIAGVGMTVEKGRARKGDIALRLVRRDPVLASPDAYRITIDTSAVVEGGTYNAVAFGMMTLLQVMQETPEGVSLPCLKIEDKADRAFRALQVSIRGGYHSPQWVKKVIDVMRFYKVRILQLHTTEILWVGSAFESSNGTDPKLLQRHAAWSRKEMDGVIAYARERGVMMIPHNEMRPNDPFWPPTLTNDFNTADKFAGYVDEVDGKGKFEIKGDLRENERFWNFLKIVTQKSYDQFAKGWPDGKLPYYHIGPVYGEGGCSGKDSVRMLGFLKEKNPDIKMMYWNGPGNNDPDLTPNRKNIVVDFYSAQWGGTPEGLLENGYELCNVSWTPLYIQPGSRVKAIRQGKWIFDEFHLGRFGAEGQIGIPIKARDCTKQQAGIIGSMLATWDFGSANDRDGHLEMITPCIPFYAEHAWNVSPWPYTPESREKAIVAYSRLSRHVNQFVMEERPSSVPGAVTSTQGTQPSAIDVFWAESDNYPSYYQVYRADEAYSNKAQVISGKIPASFVTQLNTFRDEKVQPGQKYYYWVRSVNPAGTSAFGQPVEGFCGNGVKIPSVYEPFDYPEASLLDNLNGGSGFKSPWKVVEFNAPVTVINQGLTYPGLKTSGRALHVESTDSDETNRRRPPHTSISRELSDKYGKDGTQVWASFLIKAQRSEVGGITANIGRTSIGKGWGNRISVYSDAGGGIMETNKPYFIVARYIFHKGNDLIHMWVNPVPGKLPVDEEANVITRQFDNPADDKYLIGMQPYGKGSYDIDEIRVGQSYKDVAPAGQ